MTIESQLLQLAKCKGNDQGGARCAATRVVVDRRSRRVAGRNSQAVGGGVGWPRRPASQ